MAQYSTAWSHNGTIYICYDTMWQHNNIRSNYICRLSHCCNMMSRYDVTTCYHWIQHKAVCDVTYPYNTLRSDATLCHNMLEVYMTIPFNYKIFHSKMKIYVLQNLWRNITRYLTEYVSLAWLIWYKIQYILFNRRLSVPVHIWYNTLDRGINWFIRNYILSASVFYILMSIDYY